MHFWYLFVQIIGEQRSFSPMTCIDWLYDATQYDYRMNMLCYPLTSWTSSGLTVSLVQLSKIMRVFSKAKYGKDWSHLKHFMLDHLSMMKISICSYPSNHQRRAQCSTKHTIWVSKAQLNHPKTQLCNTARLMIACQLGWPGGLSAQILGVGNPWGQQVPSWHVGL